MKAAIQYKRIPPKHPQLIGIVKNFWTINSDTPISLNHKLLPVRNIDFVFNRTSTFIADGPKDTNSLNGFIFNGIRSSYYRQKQNSPLDLFGITFYPSGVYSLLKTPLIEFKNLILEVDLIHNEFSSRVQEKINSCISLEKQIAGIEAIIVSCINRDLLPDRRIFNHFYNSISDFNIPDYCETTGIHQRNLERMFNKFIGVSPKGFLKLRRFQQCLKDILSNSYDDLTSLSFKHKFSDQAHFIRDFKSFTGSSPKQFLKDKNTMIQLLMESRL